MLIGLGSSAIFLPNNQLDRQQNQTAIDQCIPVQVYQRVYNGTLQAVTPADIDTTIGLEQGRKPCQETTVIPAGVFEQISVTTASQKLSQQNSSSTDAVKNNTSTITSANSSSTSTASTKNAGLKLAEPKILVAAGALAVLACI